MGGGGRCLLETLQDLIKMGSCVQIHVKIYFKPAISVIVCPLILKLSLTAIQHFLHESNFFITCVFFIFSCASSGCSYLKPCVDNLCIDMKFLPKASSFPEIYHFQLLQ